MRDRWYSDNRDLIKWGVLLRLAERFNAQRILQLAFYRPTAFGQLVIDGQSHSIPDEVIAHFRNLRTVSSISSRVRVTVFDPVFEDRDSHLQAVLALLPAFAGERCVVFLDPDTGLEPQNPSADHVLNDEAGKIWSRLKNGDVFALYQHQTNRAGQPWLDPKRSQLAEALQVQSEAIKAGHAPEIANDVVLFYIQKDSPLTTLEELADIVREPEGLGAKLDSLTRDRVIKFTDEGLVHGGVPENRWLEPGKNYECETLSPHTGQTFTLTHNNRFSGGRAWDCSPKIRRFLEALRIDVVGHVSKDNPVELRVRVVSSRQATE